MPLSHGGDRMTIKPDDNTEDVPFFARNFKKYMAAVEEHIERTNPKRRTEVIPNGDG